MIRVDEVEMVDQLVGQDAAGAVHDFRAEPVDVAGHRDLERGDGRLRDAVMRRVGRQVHGRQIDDQGVARRVGEDPGGGIAVTGNVCDTDDEDTDEAEGPNGMGAHSGEL